MPPIVYEIIVLIASLIRLLGMAMLGLAIGWLTLEFFRKVQQAWQLHIALYLGLVGLVIAMTYFLTWGAGALGAFGIGFGVAIFVWGLPKKKEEKKED